MSMMIKLDFLIKGDEQHMMIMMRGRMLEIEKIELEFLVEQEGKSMILERRMIMQEEGLIRLSLEIRGEEMNIMTMTKKIN
jgi:hypothetical protein